MTLISAAILPPHAPWTYHERFFGSIPTFLRNLSALVPTCG
jgi:hypothetical protein